MRRSQRVAGLLLAVVMAMAVLVLPAVVPAAADHAAPPGELAGSGVLEGTETVQDEGFTGGLCFVVRRSVFGLRGAGTYSGRTADGQEVLYRAETSPGGTLYGTGSLQVEVENTQNYYHGPGGTHGTSDTACGPATMGSPVPAEFRIFAAEQTLDTDGDGDVDVLSGAASVYRLDETGTKVPCRGQGSFARTDQNDNPNWRAEWTLGEDCVVVGNDPSKPGTGVAEARTAHTQHGTHKPCFSPPCLDNIKVDYKQYPPIAGFNVSLSGPGSAPVGAPATVTATVTDDGTAVPNAPVSFTVTGQGPAAPPAGSAVTDANGRAAFTFTTATAGDYTVTASAANAGETASATSTVTFTPASPPAMTVAGPARAQTEEDVTVAATFTNDGDPVPAASVSFTVAGPGQATPASGSAVTDANGRAAFTFVADRAGDYTVTASATHLGQEASATHTVRLDINTFRREGAITLPAGETRPLAAVIDAAGDFAYFAAGGQLVKVDLDTFQRVGSVPDVGFASSAVIDPAGRFAYFGGGLPTGGYGVIKVDLTTFQRVGQIDLEPDEDPQTALIDPSGSFAYFATYHSEDPAEVIKIDLTSFQRVSAITLAPGEAQVESAVMDPSGDSAYFGVSGREGRVVKVDLATFQRVGHIVLNGTAEQALLSAVIDPAGHYAYFGTRGPFDGGAAALKQPAGVVKVDLDTFQRAGAIVLAAEERALGTAVIDPAGNFAYFGTDRGGGQVDRVIKVDLRTSERVGAVVLPAEETGTYSAVMAPDGSYAYFGVDPNGFPVDPPARVVKVAVSRPPNPLLVAGNDSYTTPYATPLSVPARGVLANDEDTGDQDPLTSGQASDPAGGSVTLNQDGSFTYSPDAGFSGTDTFTYTASDGVDFSAPATVSISVAPPQGPIGSAYNYFTNVSLFGGPYNLRGYGQQVCTAPNTPSGCVPEADAAASASPSVACPAAGGTASATDPDGSKAQYGPAVIFSGRWPEDQGTAPPSGPLTSSIDCEPGQDGRVTATTSVALMPAGSAYPGGVGPGPFVADEVHTTCGAATAPVRVVNGVVETSYHVGDDPATPQVEEGGTVKTTEVVPTNPPPGHAVDGTLDHIGDRFRMVFNEQTTNPDGSLTVIGAHLYMFGPSAVGDMVIGSSTCGTPITTPPPVSKAVADFDGNGTTDRSVFRNGAWFAEGQATAYLGLAGDVPVPGDYDGNGVTDRAVYREGAWFVEGQETVYLGLAEDVPVPADYDGDGTTDRAVYRPSVGAWYIEDQAPLYHGALGDIPVPGDYDGNGTAEVGVFRPESGGWYVLGQDPVFLGLQGDIPVPGDYDGNGTTDRAVYRGGTWFTDGQPPAYLGLAGDVPVPGRYDTGATTDRAVWRPAAGAWHLDGQAPVYLGAQGDTPLPLPAAIHGAFF